MITGIDIAKTAVNSGLLGTPYSKMDCQAFVEAVLEKAGLHIINYRGSNHMWRDLVYDRETVKGHIPPPGSLAFIVRDDGGEKKRGYHDGMKNATHVAIVIDAETVMESTTGGVQYGKLSRFTNYGLIKDVDYSGGEEDAGKGSTPDAIRETLDELKRTIAKLEVLINECIGNS